VINGLQQAAVVDDDAAVLRLVDQLDAVVLVILRRRPQLERSRFGRAELADVKAGAWRALDAIELRARHLARCAVGDLPAAAGVGIRR